MPNSVRLITFVLPSPPLSILGSDNLHLFVLFHMINLLMVSYQKQNKIRKCFGPSFHAETAKVVLIPSNTKNIFGLEIRDDKK